MSTRALPFLLLALSVSACDGGTSPAPTPTPTPTPVNSAPAFSSAASSSVLENGAAVGTVTATDAEADALVFSISGGDDAALFQITPAGVLSFRAAPDFEAPKDKDFDQVYKVEVSVTDGHATVTQQVAVTVTDDKTSNPSTLRSVATGFTMPNNLVPIPGEPDYVLVTEKGGLIKVLNRKTGAVNTTPFLDLSLAVITDGDRGLLGLALAPDFALTGNFYVSLIDHAGNLEIRSYKRFDRFTAGTGFENVIFRLAEPSNRYVGGWIGFGPDGFLYVTTGAPRGAGDDTSNLAGKILRIDPSRDDFPADPLRDYAIPAGNPFTAAGQQPEIWVTGFANPRRASFDPAYGDLWVDDYGYLWPQSGIDYETSEINLVRAVDAGASYSLEIFPRSDPGPLTPVAGKYYPTLRFYIGLTTQLNAEGWVAGYVYRGKSEALQGWFLAGDRVWTDRPQVKVTPAIRQHQFGGSGANGAGTPNPRSKLPPYFYTNAFGVDQEQNLYLLGLDGSIFVIEAS